MKNVLVVVVGLFLLSVVSVFAEGKPMNKSKDSTEMVINKSNETQQLDKVVVYYLHMNRRCMTCKKLEAYSKEAIENGFTQQLSDSSIVIEVKNFEQKGNEHFAKDYQLYSQSLVLSRQHDGKETEWRNLDKIWELVGNKEAFTAYVQNQIKNFLNSKEDK